MTDNKAASLPAGISVFRRAAAGFFLPVPAAGKYRGRTGANDKAVSL